MTILELNHKLFLRVNALQGKNQWLDAFGAAGAEWAIIAMGAWYAVADYIAYAPSRVALMWPIVFLAAAMGVGWVVNLALAAIIREPRPRVTDASVKLLFQPLSNWKAFPSDHAMAAFLVCFMAFVFGLPGAWALIVLALWVSWGRVYSGVHYPGDILAGAAVAAVIAYGCSLALAFVI